MQLIRGLHNIRPQHKGCVLTIGKFDGVHLGHQAVLGNLRNKAEELSLPTAVMVFEPQPEEVFTPEKAPARLSRWRDKYEAMRDLGMDRLFCVHFTHSFASQSAAQFIKDILVDRLGVKFLVVGDDFRFGKGREGDFAMLVEAGKQFGFSVVNTASFRLADCRISSTAIRQALAEHDFALAQQMLGRTFSIKGRVVHGQKKGRTIGFPTANVNLKRAKPPVVGVYAVSIDICGEYYQGVANIGARPTVSGEDALLEVHIFDFSGDLYGQVIEVNVLHRLRGIQKFATFAELKTQIEQDALAARTYFHRSSTL
ncbi:bifunctional riboflavin kinase/FAD synthetase [Alteromonas sp. LMIT006]|jgi:riboflavin kinase/FMN adenylyltransferase|uniref:bifunctional riboflavin kinase/FAD synthetase n=1 Tax=Alteromonadaceae TaxID=72275 RepID=UPI0020CA5681|nr:bifunctional riboflavin kinase/FAD synthetase [Alteromonas sp. LMIT006]UTP71657.1 bifunctional riboflavin kinase/FAD synthetase [Alteromonas sp. LMIT006]